MKFKTSFKKMSEKSWKYSIVGDFTIYTVQKLKKELMERLSGISEIQLDLGGIEKFDSAGFQLLLYSKFEAQRRNKVISIGGASSKVRDVFSLYGMAL